ncbi:MAG: hypothetical protein NC483_05865 [Ruminococcus sp.]|nr:hypothetical protein [Ruminococcus sp.]
MIKIAHLYPSELNLYGENGNIKALKYALEEENKKVTIININEDAKINFKEYDFVYIGSGRKNSLELVKEKLKPYKSDILDYLNKNKIFLVTGNALSLFDFLDLYEIEEPEKRIVSDVEATTSLCNSNIYGFQNTEYLIKSTTNVIFNLNKGLGGNNTMLEGFNYKNFYVTSLIGPILARNTKLTKYFIDLLLEND